MAIPMLFGYVHLNGKTAQSQQAEKRKYLMPHPNLKVFSSSSSLYLADPCKGTYCAVVAPKAWRVRFRVEKANGGVRLRLVVEHWEWFLGPFCPKSGFPLRRFLSVKTNRSKCANSEQGGTGFLLSPNIPTFLPKSLGYLTAISTIPGTETQLEAKWNHKTSLVLRQIQAGRAQ